MFPIQAHSSVERACLLGGVHFRKIKADKDNSMISEDLANMIKEDLANGFIPFYVR